MGYRKITNLYANHDIFYFKRCLALEKIHGTSANISFKNNGLCFSSGGSKHAEFIKLFDHNTLLEQFRINAAEHPDVEKVTIFGEAYGGKLQNMKHAYGPDLKFIAFEVMVEREGQEHWFNVHNAEGFVHKFGLEFVDYVEIDATEEAINEQMMRDSVQAVRNGMGTGHIREGVVLRSLIEFVHPNGGRVISKHKRPEFSERASTPKINDPEALRVLENAQAIASEWVSAMRLEHILTSGDFPDPKIEDSSKVIKAMYDDVICEAAEEIVETPKLRSAIGKETMKYFKKYLMDLGKS